MTTQTLSRPVNSSLRWTVLMLALPAVGEQFLNMLVGLADTYLVGHITPQAAQQLGYGSANGLAAVGLANYVVWITTTIFMAGAIGSTALIARATGAKEYDEANNIVRQSLLLGIVVGLFGFLLMYASAPIAMRLFGANDEIAPLATRYLQISSFGMPLTGVTFLLNAALRGAGDTKTPLLVMLLVNGINILVSWLLVGGQYGLPVLGVDGAAWGSTLGRSIGGIFIMMLILRGRGLLRLDRLPRFHSETMGRIIRVGLPTGVEMFAFQSALIVFSRFVVSLGTIPYAAHNTVITAESISFLPGLGFAVAATTLVGQNLGAKDVQLARRSGHEAYFQSAVFMGIMGLLFILIPEFFLGLLVNNPDVVAAGVVPLQMVGVIQPLLAANFVYAGALRGAGDTVFPLLIKLVSPWLIRVPLAILLISYLGFGLRGAWIAMSVDLAIQGLLAFWRFYGDKWERIKI